MVEEAEKGLGVPASSGGRAATPSGPSPSVSGIAGIPNAATFIQCGAKPSCDHDFFGPTSFERAFDDGLGSERVCGKCGTGAMAHTLSLDF